MIKKIGLSVFFTVSTYITTTLHAQETLSLSGMEHCLNEIVSIKETIVRLNTILQKLFDSINTHCEETEALLLAALYTDSSDQKKDDECADLIERLSTLLIKLKRSSAESKEGMATILQATLEAFNAEKDTHQELLEKLDHAQCSDEELQVDSNSL